MSKKKIGLATLAKKKRAGERITMLTAYDFPTAAIFDEADVDTILVGDSLSNVMLGYPDTVPVTMDEMLHHLRAVRRGVHHALLIGDMPFGSFNVSVEEAIRNGVRFMKEGGAEAVKVEGGGPVADTIRAMVRAGLPVVGHLGLTPQTAGMIGGYRVQGDTAEKARVMIDHALGLEDAGVFLLVLECVPAEVAQIITEKLSVPTIGIGAGPFCDGQVLVAHDILGIRARYMPRFVKAFAQVEREMRRAADEYCGEVRAGTFPSSEHTFAMPDDELRALRASLDGTS
ncbi:MAG: 3-methyl-2-oxobutanoate hydroxymethyltransferase [Deltaproteobacteria bacterium]|nr:3-methyl-2-oxobutanoate hydroxymethyltransferase [Deltaproteobacteria bacterium]